MTDDQQKLLESWETKLKDYEFLYYIKSEDMLDDRAIIGVPKVPVILLIHELLAAKDAQIKELKAKLEPRTITYEAFRKALNELYAQEGNSEYLVPYSVAQDVANDIVQSKIEEAIENAYAQGILFSSLSWRMLEAGKNHQAVKDKKSQRIAQLKAKYLN